MEQDEEAAQREQQKRQRRAAPDSDQEAVGAAARDVGAVEVGPAAGFGDDEEDEEEDVNEQATAADQAFIDDTGVEPDEGADIGGRSAPHTDTEFSLRNHSFI